MLNADTHRGKTLWPLHDEDMTPVAKSVDTTKGKAVEKGTKTEKQMKEAKVGVDESAKATKDNASMKGEKAGNHIKEMKGQAEKSTKKAKVSLMKARAKAQKKME